MIENPQLVNLNNVDSLEEWLQNPDHIYIGRHCWKTRHYKHLIKFDFGNPYRYSDRRLAVINYLQDIVINKKFIEDIAYLSERALGCWCTPDFCHGDILMLFCKKYLSLVAPTIDV